MMERRGVWNQIHMVQTLTLSLGMSCVTLGQFLKHSEIQPYFSLK